MVGVNAERHQDGSCSCRRTPEGWEFLRKDTRIVGVPAERHIMVGVPAEIHENGGCLYKCEYQNRLPLEYNPEELPITPACSVLM
jgi:hypothetical protein